MNITITEQEHGLILAGLIQLERAANSRGNAITATQSAILHDKLALMASKEVTK